MNKYILILALTLSVIVGYSQNETPTSFSLQEAIDYALENNRQAKNATLDIEAAKKTKMGNYRNRITSN